MNDQTAALRTKTLILSMVVISSNVLGNFLMSWGLKQAPALSASPLSYLRVMFNPWVASGIALLILWMLARMALLSWADLSYVLPITSLGYVFSALMGQFFLNEQVSWQRWSGTLLIVAGTALVGATAPRTTS